MRTSAPSMRAAICTRRNEMMGGQAPTVVRIRRVLAPTDVSLTSQAPAEVAADALLVFVGKPVERTGAFDELDGALGGLLGGLVDGGEIRGERGQTVVVHTEGRG